jgi:archaellum component FlaF (FlaF/FlaG flagellin family)
MDGSVIAVAGGCVPRRDQEEPDVHQQRAPRAARLLSGSVFAATLIVLLVAVAGCASSSATAASGPPTPTPTAQQRLAALARHAATGSNIQRVDTTYSAQDGTVTVTVTLGGSVPVADADVTAMQARVMSMCFQTQKALWTSGIPLRSVTVTIAGPIMDQYAEREIQAYGAAVLTAAKAAKFNWEALSPDAAWTQYDNAYLRPGYYDVD